MDPWMDRRNHTPENAELFLWEQLWGPSELTQVPASLLDPKPDSENPLGLQTTPSPTTHRHPQALGVPNPSEPPWGGLAGPPQLPHRGKTPKTLPELSRAAPTPSQPRSTSGTPPEPSKPCLGKRRKARLNSWPEMKGKLSLGGWNEFSGARERGRAGGTVSCAAFPGGFHGTFRGWPRSQGAQGCSVGSG